MSQLHGTLRKILAAGKVSIGLASHWPRITDISGFPPTGSRPSEMSTHLLSLSGEWLTLPYLYT